MYLVVRLILGGGRNGVRILGIDPLRTYSVTPEIRLDWVKGVLLSIMKHVRRWMTHLGSTGAPMILHVLFSNESTGPAAVLGLVWVNLTLIKQHKVGQEHT